LSNVDPDRICCPKARRTSFCLRFAASYSRSAGECRAKPFPLSDEFGAGMINKYLEPGSAVLELWIGVQQDNMKTIFSVAGV
jgi:hypothetical protein